MRPQGAWTGVTLLRQQGALDRRHLVAPAGRNGRRASALTEVTRDRRGPLREPRDDASFMVVAPAQVAVYRFCDARLSFRFLKVPYNAARFPLRIPMALKATVHRAALQVCDLDRHYYASHALTLAQHPSETDTRLMVRLLAFGLFADERLAFGRGISSEDEPDLWRRSRTDEIEHWIALGQPDEANLRRACGRARRVTVVGYSGRGFGLWWEKNAAALSRCTNLDVVELPSASTEALTPLLARGMDLQCLIQDGEVQLISEGAAVTVVPLWHQRAAQQ